MLCTACGFENPAGFRYCGACGAPIAGTSAPVTGSAPDVSPPSAERRVVSVLFADLVGFTGHAEQRDPEEVRDLLSRYFETVQQVVARYGGTIEKFIGDAVMAVWGAPAAHEDDPERAVRAGIGLIDAVGALGRRIGVPDLSARAGVATGEAAVTLGAVGQGMVAGDVVNTAARLQTAAEPGTALVGATTYRAARGSIAFEEAGSLALRGKRSSVEAWRALRVVARRRGEGRAELPEPRLVGRDVELALVKDLFHRTADERRLRLVSVIGQAGVGKSRLVWELAKYLDGVKVYWHHARSPAYGEHLTYWPLAEMVRHRAEIAEGEEPEQSRTKLRTCLATYVPDDGERRWMERALAALLGLGQAAFHERDDIFAAWRSFFERISRHGPTVLVFDDLHWADSGVLDFIDQMLEWPRSHPILVITLARPELLERRPDRAAAHRDVVSLRLEPLEPEPMRQLLDELVHELPPRASRQILERARGIPLYAVEMVRMLADQGHLRAGQTGYEARGPLDQLSVPETLRGLVAARLDGLDVEDRSVLRDAAVLGHSFPVAALVAVSGTDPARLEPVISRLVGKELLAYEGDPRSPQHGRYRFVDWLSQEVAYATLARPDRRTRHVAAAGYYEALGDPEFTGLVASQVVAALRSAPPEGEASTLTAWARRALRAAADRAAALHSPEQALGYLEEALSVTDDAPERAELWEAAAGAAQAAARHELAEDYLRQAIEHHRGSSDTSALARVTVRLGEVLLMRYQVQDAVEMLRAAFEQLGGEASEDPDIAELTAELARAYSLHGELGQAMDWADRALATAERLDLPGVAAEALMTKGADLFRSGRAMDGLALLRRALSTAEEHNLLSTGLRARANLAAVLLDEDPRAAFDESRAGLAQAYSVGLRDMAVRLLSVSAGDSALDVGEWDWALSALAELEAEGLTVVDQVDLESAAALILAWRGDPAAGQRFEMLKAKAETGGSRLATAILSYRLSGAALSRGEPVQALERAEVAASLLEEEGYVLPALSLGWSAAGRAALWAGNRARLAHVVSRFEGRPLDSRWWAATRRTLLAGLAALDGNVAEAIALYREAVESWRELRLPFRIALCQLDQAIAISEGAEPALQRAAADEARAIFSSLRAEAFLRLMATRLPDLAVSPA